MGERIEYDCVECGEPDRIDSTSLNFITSISPLNRDEAKLCDECLSDELSGMHLDLSIGGQHTQSQQFEAMRERRQQDADQRFEAMQQPVEFQEVYVVDDPSDGEIDAVMVAGPSEAWTDIKELSTPYVRFSKDEDNDCHRIALRAALDVKNHLEDRGWTVHVGPDVKRQMG